MREINVSEITDTIEDMCIEANCVLNSDIECALKRGYETEQSEIGRSVLGNILKNAEIAREEYVPICQDTGMAVIFLKIGQDVHITGGLLSAAAMKKGI